MPTHYEFFLHTYDPLRKFVSQSSVLFREVLWLDCILSGCSTLMPSSSNLLLHRHDLHQKSFCESSVPFTYDPLRKFVSQSSVLFREVLWLDCILLGCSTLMPSSSNLLLHRHDLQQKSFCESSVPFRKVVWLYCILPGVCTLMPSCYNLLLHRHDLHQNSFC